MTRPAIHLVFKTHLDIGFTNLAETVRKQYQRHFIPQALDTAEHFHGEDPSNPKFVWTTGAWLISDYLSSAEREEVKRLERAIDLGLIRWHALPFTTHSELMSPALIRAGLSFAKDLDRRFGRQTRAAKMTDVPGHTRGIVPLLAEAGVRFLHVGVNEASPLPDVPSVFRWRADGGEEVIVMYQDSYGATLFPAGHDFGLSFAHTGDNAGPQTISQTIDAYRLLQSQYPDAEINASTLDQYGDLLWEARAQLPVLDVEIGDSWIHGVGSDPDKVSRFLALQRLYDQWAIDILTPQRLAFGRALTMVPEHTWGVDIKTFLRDDKAWDRTEFEVVRKHDSRFALAERSWVEQQQYLDKAIAHLEGGDRTKALIAATPYLPPRLDGRVVRADSVESVKDWRIAIDPQTGDIGELTSPLDRRLIGQGGTLFGFCYETYDATDVTAHIDSYLTRRPDWAILDHTKPGLAQARTAQSAQWQPSIISITQDEAAISILSALPTTAHRDFGAPASVELVLRPFNSRSLSITLIARNKPANRMPEASFLTFAPQEVEEWRFRKVGHWQRADKVALRGGGHLQAVEAVAATFADGLLLEIAPLDTPLVSPRASSFMRFNPGQPNFDTGVRFNLHNNKWGTNFPMWWGGDFAARFVLCLHTGAGPEADANG